MESKENCVEFLTGQHTATLSLTHQKYISRMNKLYETNKEDFEFFEKNNDGSICCKVPLKWVKISPPRKVSDEARQAASERFRKLHEDGKL